MVPKNMKQSLKILLYGIREPFKKTNYILLLLVLFFVMFTLLFFIPIWTVVGSTIATQITILDFRAYAVIILLSALYSLFITMQVYVMRSKRKVEGVSTAVSGGLGTLFAGIVGTSFCAPCFAPLFAFFGIGFGGVLFVLEYRFYFVIGITLIMLVAIYLTARKINKVCTSC